MSAKWWRVVLLGAFVASAQPSRATAENVYVWLFNTVGAEAEGLTDMVTEEFEESLVKARCLQVIERRRLPELQVHQEQERRLAGPEALTPATVRRLRTEDADYVTFGKITDDIQGGQIKIAITLQTLSGVTIAESSVRLNRGQRFDAQARELKIRQLASDVCKALGLPAAGDSGPDEGHGGGADVAAGGDDAPNAAVAPRPQTIQSYEFFLEGCAAVGSDVECWFRVVNHRERRRLIVKTHSRLVAANGNSYEAKYVLLGGGGLEGVWATFDLANGVPGRFGLHFEGLGGYVRSIALLDVVTSEFNVEWRTLTVR